MGTILEITNLRTYKSYFREFRENLKLITSLLENGKVEFLHWLNYH